MKTLLTTCLLLLAMSLQAQSLQPNLKFGKPTDEELQLTTYAPDTEAVAVVLCSLTDVYYDYRGDDFRIVYDIKRRIKVLKPEGRDLANVTIGYYDNESNHSAKEQVTGLKATAYNQEDGKLVKTRMKGEQQFTERLDKEHLLCKFTVPQVKVGTVIEYEYKLESDFYYSINDWYAQTSVPTLYTRYELTTPEWFRFSINETGTERLDSQREPTNMAFIIGGESLHCGGTRHVFTGHDLPAVRDDAFVWCAQAYASHVTAELNSIVVPGFVYKDYAMTWDGVVKTLMDDDDFGNRLKRRNPLKDQMTAAGIYQMTDTREKILATYDVLTQHVRWNGTYAFWGQPIGGVVKAGTGTNADLNFILMSMLRDAGVRTYPVVLRSRDRGVLPAGNASLKFLNTFVVAAYDTDTTAVYLDGSGADGYLNVLPARLLADRALAIEEKKATEWINLQTIGRGRTATQVTAELHADGTLTGQRTSNYVNNVAADFRRQFRQAQDSAAFVAERAEKADVELTHYQLTGHRDFAPSVTETMTFAKTCDATDDHIYLNPFIFIPQKESPFTAAERRLPVEFPYLQQEAISVRLTLPEGYTVEEKPAGLQARLGQNDAVCRVLCVVNGREVNVSYTVYLGKLLFTPDEYGHLKDFFDKLTESVNNMLVLKKAE